MAPDVNNKLQCISCLHGNYQMNEGQTQCRGLVINESNIAVGLSVSFGVVFVLLLACLCTMNRRELRTYFRYKWLTYFGTKHVQSSGFDNEMVHMEADNMIT